MTDEEQRLLEKLSSGALDGMVGNERVYGTYKNVYCGKYIRDGIPVSYRQGESSRFFNGKENETIPGARQEEHRSLLQYICPQVHGSQPSAGDISLP